jgi:hypothetical protein
MLRCATDGVFGFVAGSIVNQDRDSFEWPMWLRSFEQYMQVFFKKIKVRSTAISYKKKAPHSKGNETKPNPAMLN